MNLKEAFRFQNVLNLFTEQACGILADDDNITHVVTHTYCRKVMPEAENIVTENEPSCEFSDNITDLAAFTVYLLEEKEKLAAAIRAAKDTLPIDMDAQVGLNANRQSLARVLNRMVALRGSERVVANGGTGYRFNTDGAQVSYRCPIKTVTTINYDRDKVRHLLSKLTTKSDAVSAELDLCLINSVVDYAAPFDVNDSFREVFCRFAGLEE